MYRLAASVLALFLAAVSLSAQNPEKPNLSGTWVLDRQKCDLSSTKIDVSTWVIDQGRNKIKITESGPDRKGGPSEFECGTMGKECEISGDPPHKVSMYFDGPALVQFHRLGIKEDNVSRHTIKLGPEKKTLIVDIAHVVPEGKPEKLIFNKQE